MTEKEDRLIDASAIASELDQLKRLLPLNLSVTELAHRMATTEASIHHWLQILGEEDDCWSHYQGE